MRGEILSPDQFEGAGPVSPEEIQAFAPPAPPPTLDEFLNRSGRPTLDQFLVQARAKPPSGNTLIPHIDDLLFGGTAPDKRALIPHLLRGYAAGGGLDDMMQRKLGPEPDNGQPDNRKSAEQYLRDSGLYGPLVATERTYFQQFNETLISGTAAIAFQAIPGAVRGVSEMLSQGFGVPRDLTPQAGWEAFPVGHSTGLPGRVPIGKPTGADLNTAAELGVFGDLPSADLRARQRLAPSVVATEAPPAGLPEPPRSAMGYTMQGVPETDPIHALARQLNPQVIEQYEALREQRAQLSEWIGSQAAEGVPTPEIEWARGYRKQVEEQMRDLAPQYTDVYREAQGQLRSGEAAPAAGETQIRMNPQGGFDVQTPDGVQRASTRAEAEALAARYERLTPDQATAYERSTGRNYEEDFLNNTVDREAAQRAAAPEGAVRVGDRVQWSPGGVDQFAEPKTIRAIHPSGYALVEGSDTGLPLGELTVVRKTSAAELPTGFTVVREGGRYSVRDNTGREVSSTTTHDAGVQAARDEAAKAAGVQAKTAAPAARQVNTLSQRAPSIAAETRQRLILAGTPADVATAQGRVVQAYYETRAERFNGELGSAQELFNREAIRPEAGGAGRGTARGQIVIRGARKIIRLFDNADASTFMHESAHDWIEQVWRDKDHPAATPEFLADVQTLRDWFKLEEGEALSRKAHEQFAQGFERYLMEGQAPSSRLASVFEKLKNWLTSIYEGLRGPGSRYPITDEIRGVYDRLLSTPSGETVIAGERPGVSSFAEEARTAVNETPAAEAATRADQVAAEREAAAAGLREDVNDGRREARGSDEGAGVSDGGGERPGGEPGGEAAAEADAGIDPIRDPTAPEVQTPPDGEPFEGRTTRLVDKAGNIRLENLAVPEDVADAIRESAGRNNGHMESRRGVLSDAEVIKLSEDLGVDPNFIDRWAVGTAWNAEEIDAARKLLREAGADLKRAAQRLDAFGTEEAMRDYAQAETRLDMIQARVSGATAEWGRAGRSFRALSNEDRAAQNIVSLLQRAIGDTPGDLRRRARLIAAAEDPTAVNNAVQNKHGKFGSMFVEAWTNWLVSGPWTQVINTVSNFGVSALSIAETAAAAGVGRTIRTFGGTQGVTLGEVVDRLHGFLEGTHDGLKAAGAILMDESKIPRVHTEVGQGPAIPGLAGKIIRYPGRALSASDEISKAIAWQQEINVLARRTAINEGHTGDALAARMNWLRGNPTDSMRAAAEQFAEYQTFQTQLGKWGNIALQAADSHPLARFVFPFVRTPINLFKYAGERTPVAFMSREVRAALTSKNAAVRDTQIARMAVGTTAMAGAGYLAFQGIQGLISGGGPSDPAERAALLRTGWQPYSVKVGGIWISYQRFDPFSTVIGAASDIADLAKFAVSGKDTFGNDLTVGRFTEAAVMVGWRNIVDKMSLRGVTSLVQAATDPKRYGEAYIQAAFGSLIPSLSGQLARAMDPFERELSDNLWGLRDAAFARIPWARETLYPKRDLWGEPISNAQWGPIQMRAFNADPVNAKMIELGLAKGRAEKTHNGVTLTPAQYDDYARISGQTAKGLLDQIVSQPSFSQNPLGVQVMTINRLIQSAHKIAMGRVIADSYGTADDLVKKGLDIRTMFLETGHRTSP